MADTNDQDQKNDDQKNNDQLKNKRTTQSNTTNQQQYTDLISSNDIHTVSHILYNKFPHDMVEAIKDNTKLKDLKQIIMTEPAFSTYPCYQNSKVADIYCSQIANLGIVDYLLKSTPGITDIGYNGRYLTIETNDSKYRYGNRPGHRDEPNISKDDIMAIISTFTKRQGDNGEDFSPKHPIFNGFSNNLRVSANYTNLSPVGITMALRVSRPTLPLNQRDFEQFAPQFIYDILDELVKSSANIIISGETGTGKTELLKLLVGNIPDADKIIMIEDIAETHLTKIYPQKDIVDWTTTETIQIWNLVMQALRFNPQHVLVSETRGQEAYQMYQSVLSGHSIMTTMHSISNEAVPERFYGMCSMSDHRIPDNLEAQFREYMHIGIHIDKKIIGGRVFRYMDEMAEFVPKSEEHPNGVNVLYSAHMDGNGHRSWRLGTPTDKIKNLVYEKLNAKFEFPPKDEPSYRNDERVPTEEELLEKNKDKGVVK